MTPRREDVFRRGDLLVGREDVFRRGDLLVGWEDVFRRGDLLVGRPTYTCGWNRSSFDVASESADTDITSSSIVMFVDRLVAAPDTTLHESLKT